MSKMMNNLSLSELYRLQQQIRDHKLGITFRGEAEVKIFNADGSLDQAVKQKNAETPFLRALFNFQDQARTTMIVFIANDDGWPMDRWKSFIPHNYTTDSHQADGRSLDSANLIWTFQTTFAAPAVNRTFRYVGLSASDWGPAPSPHYFIKNNNVYAATRLTSQLTQTTTQTLEVTYRLAWQRV